VISPSSGAPAPTYTVVVSEKGGAERREGFTQLELSVGRVQGNDVMLPKGNVSKRHARLVFRDGRFIVTDLNSTNGTYVNRRRIAQATIVKEGDRIYIGDFVLRIEIGDAQSVSMTQTEGSSPRAAAARATHPDSVDEPESVDASRPPSTGDSQALTPVPEPRSPSPSTQDMLASSTTPNARVDQVVQEHRRAVARLLTAAEEALGGARLSADFGADVRSRAEEVVRATLDSMKRAGELPASGSEAAFLREALDELLDLGPITGLLADVEVSEISIPRFDAVFATRRGRLVPIEPSFSSAEALERVVQRLARRAGEPVAAGQSVVERRLSDGTRLNAVLKPSVVLSLKKPRTASVGLDELVRLGTLSRSMATVLGHAVQARANLLVVGARDSGREMLLSALSLHGQSPLILVSDSDDVRNATTSVTRLSPREAGRDVRGMLSAAAALAGTRLAVVAETPEVCAATLETLSRGAEGVVVTLESPDVYRALLRLSVSLMREEVALGADAARTTVASAFDLVVEVAELRDGRPRVVRISEVAGPTASGFEVVDVFRFVVERTAAGGSVEGAFVPTGHVPHLAEQMRARGLPVESSMFSRPPSR
jgi:pilus assembly protein CpaF